MPKQRWECGGCGKSGAATYRKGASWSIVKRAVMRDHNKKSHHCTRAKRAAHATAWLAQNYDCYLDTP